MVDCASPERRAAEAPPGRRRRSFAAQPAEELRDVAIALRLHADLPRGPDGVPLVSGPVPSRSWTFRTTPSARMLAERIETAFFVDLSAPRELPTQVSGTCVRHVPESRGCFRLIQAFG